jgi:cell division protein FtsN
MAIAARGRRQRGPGTLVYAALGGAGLVMLALTFGLGVFVGRQWAQQMPAVAAVDARRSPAPSRRNGLSELGVERATPPREKLTFYQTLTAPLGAMPRPAKTEGAPKSPAGGTPRPSPPPAADHAQPRASERATETLLPPRAAGPEGAERPSTSVADRREASADWTVQVGVFKSQQQAERIRKNLAEAGFPALVTARAGDDGETRYRVRVGEFKTRDEALRTAERVRAGRSLSTFVTVK